MVIDDDGTDAWLQCCKLEGAWDIQYVDDGNEEYGNVPEHPVQADTEDDARAKMLIYLIEKKLINFA
jgi:hypothetical protein